VVPVNRSTINPFHVILAEREHLNPKGCGRSRPRLCR
jgi:hypothetical protein